PILSQGEANPEVEINLEQALQALEAAAPKTAHNKSGNGHDGAYAEGGDWHSLIEEILTGESYHAAITRLAAKMTKAGMNDGASVNVLKALMENSRGPRDARWPSRYYDISRSVSTAREKYAEPNNAADATDSKTTPPPVLPWINMSSWDSEPVPEQDWAVLDRIPLRQVTLFSGEGAAGKSTEQVHLSAAHALARDWLGTMPEPGPALFVDAEDDDKVLHRRLAAILNHYGVTFKDVVEGGLHLISLAGHDAVLAAASRSGKIEPTPRYKQLLEAAGDIRPKMIGIASSA